MKSGIVDMANQLLLTSMGKGLMEQRAADAASSTSNALVNSTNSTSLAEWASNATSNIGESSYTPSPMVSAGLLLAGLAVAGAVTYLVRANWHSASDNNDVSPRIGVEIEELPSDSETDVGAQSAPSEVAESKAETPPPSPESGESTTPVESAPVAKQTPEDRQALVRAVSEKLNESTEVQASEVQGAEKAPVEAGLAEGRKPGSEVGAEIDQKNVVVGGLAPAFESKAGVAKAPKQPTIEQARSKAAMKALYPETPEPITVRQRQNDYIKNGTQATPEQRKVEKERAKAAMKALYPETPAPITVRQRQNDYIKNGTQATPEQRKVEKERAKAAMKALYPETPAPITVRQRQNDYIKNGTQATPEQRKVEKERAKAAMKALYPETPAPTTVRQRQNEYIKNGTQATPEQRKVEKDRAKVASQALAPKSDDGLSTRERRLNYVASKPSAIERERAKAAAAALRLNK